MAVNAVNGAYSSYTFYFPYTVIGRIRVSYTNAATPGFLDLGNFSVVGYNLDTTQQVETFANMLNHTDSCNVANYENLKVVYDYIASLNLEGDLANYQMDLQPGYTSNLSAAELWSILSARYSVPAGQAMIIDEEANATRNATLLVVFFGAAITIYFVFEQKRKKSN
jgi:hypothetical protein